MVRDLFKTKVFVACREKAPILVMASKTCENFDRSGNFKCKLSRRTCSIKRLIDYSEFTKLEAKLAKAETELSVEKDRVKNMKIEVKKTMDRL